MKLSMGRLKEIIKEELFYREFYRTSKTQSLNEGDEVLGIDPNVKKAADLLKPLNLTKDEIDELLVLLATSATAQSGM